MSIQINLSQEEHKTLMAALEIAHVHINPLTQQASDTNALTLKLATAAIPKLYPDVYYDFVLKEGNHELDAPRKIALTLLHDILDRRGYRQEFESNMDEDIQNEIVDEWVKLITGNINREPMVIAKVIEADVRSRGGWDNIYYSIDDDIREEMLETWAEKMQEFLPVPA